MSRPGRGLEIAEWVSGCVGAWTGANDRRPKRVMGPNRIAARAAHCAYLFSRRPCHPTDQYRKGQGAPSRAASCGAREPPPQQQYTVDTTYYHGRAWHHGTLPLVRNGWNGLGSGSGRWSVPSRAALCAAVGI